MIDELWPGGPRFKERTGVFRLSTDSVLLAYFADCSHVKRAIDLGCGSGILPVLLAWNNHETQIDGIEINPEAARLARENAELCGLSDRINIIGDDLRCHREILTAGAYDLTISNPPYYAHGRGRRASVESIAQARGEECCTLTDICQAAGYLTRWGGRFALVHKPERLAEIFAELSGAGLEPKRMRFIQHKAYSPPSLVLIEARRGGKHSMLIEAPLILANDDGSDSDEVKEIYHR